ncbi:uncharacterized protein LOC108650670 [Drosophila navojoa]|uniref:uncharacterized protein LOC108650670 n=1 Tax=Drosophila navojoa TaxID=7232 RepID=UPI0008470196|nr:uncharacterized protein LOC108650670 [Drosophila navojoa]
MHLVQQLLFILLCLGCPSSNALVSLPAYRRTKEAKKDLVLFLPRRLTYLPGEDANGKLIKMGSITYSASSMRYSANATLSELVIKPFWRQLTFFVVALHWTLFRPGLTEPRP